MGFTPVTGFASDNVDYELRDLDGNLHRVSDYRGKWLIINFWATWCPPCISEMPELQSFYQQNNAIAQVWGVTFEDTDKAKILQFIEQLGITYPVLGYGQDPLTGFGGFVGRTFMLGVGGCREQEQRRKGARCPPRVLGVGHIRSSRS